MTPAAAEDVKPMIIDFDAEARRLRIQVGFTPAIFSTIKLLNSPQADILAKQAAVAASQADIAAMQAELSKLGNANGASTSGSSRVKPERASSPISVPRSGEVIDLTDD